MVFLVLSTLMTLTFAGMSPTSCSITRTDARFHRLNCKVVAVGIYVLTHMNNEFSRPSWNPGETVDTHIIRTLKNLIVNPLSKSLTSIMIISYNVYFLIS